MQNARHRILGSKDRLLMAPNMFQGTPPERHDGWHIKKEVQIGHLISTIVIAASAILYIGDIKRDVEVLKVHQMTQKERDDRQDRQLAEDLAVVRAQLRDISAKTDRILESQLTKR